MPKPTDEQRLLRLLRGDHPCILMQTFEEEDAASLVTRVAIEAGKDLFCWSADRGAYHGILEDGTSVEDTKHAAAGLFYLKNRDNAAICLLIDLLPHLRASPDPALLRHLREFVKECGRKDRTVILLDHDSDVPPVVAAHATRFDLSLPDEAAIEQIIRRRLRSEHKRKSVKVDMNRATLGMVVKNLAGLTRRRIEQIVSDTVVDDRTFSADDLNHVLALKRQALGGSGLLEYVETPASMSEIGGMAKLKKWLKQREAALSDEAAEFGLHNPRGVLLLGVQGAGKSYCAKAIATAWQRPLLRLDPSVLYDRYIGESERRLRDALRQAQAMAPIILWIDEIEKGFASAASRSVDGGLSQRMFGSLLTWMQDHTAPVFLVATANNIDALPPELLRKGRFDEIFFVDLPDKPVRQKIFEIHLHRRGRDPKQFDVKKLAEVSAGYSGAEIEQAVIAGLYEAFSEGAELATRHVVHALEHSPPLSVTMAEKVAALRAWAVERCVPAD